jgi:hypothetical protein
MGVRFFADAKTELMLGCNYFVDGLLTEWEGNSVEWEGGPEGIETKQGKLGSHGQIDSRRTVVKTEGIRKRMLG